VSGFWKVVLLAALVLMLLPARGAHEHKPTKPKPEDEARFLKHIRQLTFEGDKSGEGYFSPDGRYMVFQSERAPGNPFYQIYLLDRFLGRTQLISTGQGRTTCAWIHPSGQRILFASSHLDPGLEATVQEEVEARKAHARRYSWSYDPHYEIFAKDLQTGELTRLTQVQGYDAEGAYSPDGSKIVFASNRQAYEGTLTADQEAQLKKDASFFMDIYLMDADGSNVRRLTDAPGYDGGPFFSADGRRVCWRRFTPDGKSAEIWTMNSDGSDQKQLTRTGHMSWAPFFHPSGQYLIFASNPEGHQNFELYLVDAAGQREPVRVTHTDKFDGLPVFLPHGRGLAWTSQRWKPWVCPPPIPSTAPARLPPRASPPCRPKQTCDATWPSWRAPNLKGA
jgi:Tol biopolymer transport system component